MQTERIEEKRKDLLENLVAFLRMYGLEDTTTSYIVQGYKVNISIDKLEDE